MSVLCLLLPLSLVSVQASDPKFSSNYRTKPLLFGELKGKTRPYGILDKFEEDRKKAKENNDRYMWDPDKYRAYKRIICVEFSLNFNNCRHI